MPTFNCWDIVRVPFPHRDRPVRQRRPALVVAAETLLTDHGLIWVAMITSAENRRWAGDVVIDDLQMAGLPAPSIVRTAKIATLEAGDIETLGVLSPPERQDVTRRIKNYLVEITLQV